MSEPILVKTDTAYINALFSCWNLAKTAVQNVVTIYNGLGYGDLTNAELSDLFTTPEELVFDKITGGALDIGGTIIERSKAIEMVQRPAEYNSLIAAIKLVEANATSRDNRRASSVFSNGSQIDVSFRISRISTYFKIDVNGDVQFSDYHQAQLDSMGKWYVRTDKGIAIYNFLQDVFAAYTARGLDQYFGSHYDPMLKIIKEGVQGRNAYKNTLTIDPGLDAIS